MSKYTIELKTIIESLLDNKDKLLYSNLQESLKSVRTKIFDFDFPIFNETYREVLEIKFLQKFLFWEIGITPYSRWKWELMNKLNEIMPYYNQLYLLEEERSGLNLFDNINYTENLTENRTKTDSDNINRTESIMNDGSGNSTGQGSGTGKSTTQDNVNKLETTSNTPQTNIQQFQDNKYLSGARKNVDSDNRMDNNESNYNDTTNTEYIDNTDKKGTEDRNGIENENEEKIRVIKGKTGNETFLDLMIKSRESFISIDKMLLDELEIMFMNVY